MGKSGLAKRCLVQLSYAIGVAKPLSLFVETYGSECGKLTADDITNVLKIECDARPGAIAVQLALREPKYQETAAYCHFGRAVHHGWHQILRVGERQGHEEVRIHGLRSGERCAQ